MQLSEIRKSASAWASEAILGEINRAAVPLAYGPEDHNALLDWVGDRKLVMIGAASHGTHEFYSERARITRRLIEEKGFNVVAIEGDWPDAYRVHRFVTGRSRDYDTRAALIDFLHFPAWLGRNMDVLAFVDWLRGFNAGRPSAAPVAFLGLDLYSLNASMRAVLQYLDRIDPQAAQRARYRYACFDHVGDDPQAKEYAAGFGLSPAREDHLVAQLVELRRRNADLTVRDGHGDKEDFLFAEQNARLLEDADRYYHAMFQDCATAWNQRDRHMHQTLEWIRAIRPDARIVVWAHNSHVGDARATEMANRGQINLGQLARESFPDEMFLLGFTTNAGEVTAASEWDQPAQRNLLRHALSDSYEELFHRTGLPAFFLPLHQTPVRQLLDRTMLERAIGVIYRPESERISHYFHARLAAQFDAVLHLDRTHALIPFERTSVWTAGERPEAYPYAV
jgi:erythromycin esterase-like protein